ncbi:Alpha/Beta hydrolase protein, partial [Jimgerdemannia flammicorona]
LSCPQQGTKASQTSEDCLYLNIYAPPEEDAPVGGLPVLLFIHGGSFQIGSASIGLYDATNLVSEFGRVIVVTIQYRLGVFGFLAAHELVSETTEGIAGNYGLLDQKTAIEWVHKHIVHFGGDPSRITIWGQSAGASSVHYHLHLLPPGLIRRAIISSSPIMAPPPLQNARPQFERLCAALGIETERKDTMEKLRNVEPQKLLKAALGVKEYWNPVVDGVVFKEGFNEGWQGEGWKAAGVDAVVVGTMKDEGSILTLVSPPMFTDAIQKTYPNAIITDEVLSPIYDSKSYPTSYIRAATIISDARYQAPNSRLVRYLAADPSRRVYRFRFDHVAPLVQFVASLVVRVGNGTWWKPWTWLDEEHGAGAFHVGDLVYLFLHTWLLWGRDEVRIAKKMAGLWIGFVESGEMGPEWEIVGPEGEETANNILVVGKDKKITMEREVFRAKQVTWWNEQVRPVNRDG